MNGDAEFRRIQRELSIEFARERVKYRRLFGVIGLAEMIARDSKGAEARRAWFSYKRRIR